MVISSGYKQNSIWTLKPQLRMLEIRDIYYILHIAQTHFLIKIFHKIKFVMFQGSIISNRETVQNEDKNRKS